MADNSSLWLANPVFAAAGAGECDRLAAQKPVRSYEAGAPIATAGEISEQLFVLLEGSVRVFHRTEDGRETVARVLRAPAVFGDSEALLGLPLLGGLVALDEVLASWVDVNEFVELPERRPAAMKAHLRHLAASACVEARNQQQVFGSLEQRVAHVVLTYADLFGVEDGVGRVVVEFSLSQQLLARSLGAAERSVRLVLRRWKLDGLLRKQGGCYVLLQPAKLEDLAHPMRGGLCYQMGMPLEQLSPVPAISVAEVVERVTGRRLDIADELILGSSQHCRIYQGSTGGRFWIEDVNGESGTTFLNGRPVVRRAVLRDGDRIEVEGQLLGFRQRRVPSGEVPTIAYVSDIQRNNGQVT